MSAVEQRMIEATSSAICQRIDEAKEAPVVESRGPAEIIPFPAARRQHQIRRELASVSSYEPDARYRYLTSVVRKHRSHLHKLGVPPERIAADVRALEEAFGLAAVASASFERRPQ
jgi:hypothetical protein